MIIRAKIMSLLIDGVEGGRQDIPREFLGCPLFRKVDHNHLQLEGYCLCLWDAIRMIGF